jgi:hypothetical protein
MPPINAKKPINIFEKEKLVFIVIPILGIRLF